MAISGFGDLPQKRGVLQELETIAQDVREKIEWQGAQPDCTTQNRQKVLPLKSELDKVLTDEEDVLSDLDLVENQLHNRDAPAGYYTVDYYAKDTAVIGAPEKGESSSRDESEVVIFPHTLKLPSLNP